MLNFWANKKLALKNVSQDVVLNIIASFVSTGVMQLVLYPQLALNLDDDNYGEMLTIMGIVNVLALTFGNNLCNARIILNEKYKQQGKIGDFHLLLYYSVMLASIIVIGFNFYFKWKWFFLLSIVILTGVTILKSYYLVAFRIEINYKKNLYANIIMAIFYILGAFLFIKVITWPWVFSLACISGIIYIAFSSKILKESLKKTDSYCSTRKVVLLLIVSGLIGNITMYLDRFIVYPALGGSSVSYYTVASFFPKTLAIVLLPITSVLLTYIASDRIIMTRKRFNWINIGLAIFITLFFILSISIGPFITKLLYPTLFESSSSYIVLAAIGVVIGSAVTFNGTVVLAKAPSYWQVILAVINLSVYFIACVILVKYYALYGLCYGVIISNTINLLVNYLVGYYYLRPLSAQLIVHKNDEKSFNS